MIKFILALVFIHGVLSGPVSVPFNDYEGPLSENAEDSSQLQLPGTRNLDERSQVRVDLPGTRNLVEKSIPDTITLRKIPIPSSELEDELPKYIYDGSFASGSSDVSANQPEVRVGGDREEESSDANYSPAAEQAEVKIAETETTAAEEQPYHYPPAQGEETANPSPQAEQQEQPYHYEVPAVEKKEPEIIPSSTSAPETEQEPQPYYYYPAAVEVEEAKPEIGDTEIAATPAPAPAPAQQDSGYEDQPYYYPVPELQREETGSDIKDTASPPDSYTPLQLPLADLPGPNEFNRGEEIQESSISPDSVPVDNSEDKNQLNLAPDSSIKLQDNRGQYSHGFSNADGTQVQESGRLITTDNGWEYVIAKEGSYSYESPEGIPINVRYIADEKGFRILSQNFAGR